MTESVCGRRAGRPAGPELGTGALTTAAGGIGVEAGVEPGGGGGVLGAGRAVAGRATGGGAVPADAPDSGGGRDGGGGFGGSDAAEGDGVVLDGGDDDVLGADDERRALRGGGAGGTEITIVGSRSLASLPRAAGSVAGDVWVRGTLGNAPARDDVRGSGADDADAADDDETGEPSATAGGGDGSDERRRGSRAGPGQSQIERGVSVLVMGAFGAPDVANAGVNPGSGGGLDDVGGALAGAAAATVAAAIAGAMLISGSSLRESMASITSVTSARPFVDGLASAGASSPSASPSASPVAGSTGLPS